MNATKQAQYCAANPDGLRRALDGAEIVPLLTTLVQITGRTEFLDKARPYISGGWNFQQTIPDTLQNEIRGALFDALLNAGMEGIVIPEQPDARLVGAMMNVAVGQEVPDIYKPVLRDEMNFGGLDHRRVEWRRTPGAGELDAFVAVIVGAGLSGIAAAIKLQEAGIPYLVIEKNADAGGTWLENVYPGCGVDTPCHFYSYAFEPNPDWTQYFVKRDELLGYAQKAVEKYGIRNKIRFSEEVTRADYDRERALWIVRTRHSDGREQTLECNVLISAVGALNRPAIPDIPGRASFKGKAFHTAQWDKTADISGRKVALIGTGASGLQVGPAVAPEVERLTIFQRSPHWVINHPLYHADVSPAVRWAMKYIPFYANWFRFQLFWAASDGFHATLKMDPAWTDPKHSLNAANAKLREDLIAHIRSELGDREDLLPKVIPEYPPFGKRMLRDTHWYKMLRRANVELVTGRIDRIEERAIVSGGVSYPTDILVFATGFQASRMLWPMQIVGKDGVSLRDIWGDDDPRAHLGITVPGFPNFFMIYGPNTNLAHGGSAIFHSECQVRYIMLAIRQLIEGRHRAMEVRQAPFEAYNARLDVALKQMSWSHPSVTNWYKNKSGRVVMNSPWRLVDYRNLTNEIDLSEYIFDDVTPHVINDAVASREALTG
jgi:4-hydroxyacetophenone monooxygenase